MGMGAGCRTLEGGSRSSGDPPPTTRTHGPDRPPCWYGCAVFVRQAGAGRSATRPRGLDEPQSVCSTTNPEIRGSETIGAAGCG
eukprot:1891047-Pyramimonas_sp.AAC.1